MRRTLCNLILSTVVLTAAAASADNVLADQGAPGNQGPWSFTSVTPTPGPTASRRATYAPTVTTTTLNATGSACIVPAGAGCTIIQAQIELISWTNLTITIMNGGANALTACLIEWSPDGTNWEVWDSTTFSTLAASATLSLAMAGNSRRYLRIEARSTSGSSASVWLTMNDG